MKYQTNKTIPAQTKTVTQIMCDSCKKDNLRNYYKCEICKKDLCKSCTIFEYWDIIWDFDEGDHPIKYCKSCHSILKNKYEELFVAIHKKYGEDIEDLEEQYVQECLDK